MNTPSHHRESLHPPIDDYNGHLFQSIPLYLDADGRYPNGAVEDWRGQNNPENRIDIHDSFEPLVNISSSDPPIFCTNDYTAKLDNSAHEQALADTVLSQYVRQSVAERLNNVQRQLPPKYRLIVYDGWRSLETQLDAYSLCFDSIVDTLVNSNNLPSRNLSPEIREIISLEAQKYISLPSPMPPSTNPTPESVELAKTIPSPHNTGGSVDVAIVRIDDEAIEELERLEKALSGETNLVTRAQLNFELAAIYRMHAALPDFGTDFDFAGEQSALTHFEHDNASENPKQWRRLLYNLMVSAGFESYSEEWWHFNFGNQMAERTKWLRTGNKGTAIYGNIDLTTEQREFEKLHDIVFEELVRAHEAADDNYTIKPMLARLGVTATQLLDASKRIGDPRQTRSLGDPHDLKYRGKLPVAFIHSIADQLDREAA